MSEEKDSREWSADWARTITIGPPDNTELKKILREIRDRIYKAAEKGLEEVHYRDDHGAKMNKAIIAELTDRGFDCRWNTATQYVNMGTSTGNQTYLVIKW